LIAGKAEEAAVGAPSVTTSSIQATLSSPFLEASNTADVTKFLFEVKRYRAHIRSRNAAGGRLQVPPMRDMIASRLLRMMCKYRFRKDDEGNEFEPDVVPDSVIQDYLEARIREDSKGTSVNKIFSTVKFPLNGTAYHRIDTLVASLHEALENNGATALLHSEEGMQRILKELVSKLQPKILGDDVEARLLQLDNPSMVDFVDIATEATEAFLRFNKDQSDSNKMTVPLKLRVDNSSTSYRSAAISARPVTTSSDVSSLT
jgi:hypothetical protein